MNKALEILPGLSLMILPMLVTAQTLPPPGGPYPSTVVAVEPAETTPQPEQLRFPPPDLVAPAPPPPSLSEELGPDFKDAATTVDANPTAPVAPSGYPPSQSAPAYAPPAYTGGRDYGGSTPPAATAGSQQWPGYAPGYPAQPAAPTNAWSAQQPGATYPGYGYGYPYGYGTPSYGYGYPGSGYAPEGTWNDSMQTPFGSMPGPWDSMPKSFFPGR